MKNTLLISVFILTTNLVFGQSFLPEKAGLDAEKAFTEHPCYIQISNFMANQQSVKINPTSFTKEDYIRVVANEVAALSCFQNSQGQIIDPIRGREWQYATPCFAHCVAGLLAAKHPMGEKYKQSGILAFNVALEAMLLGNKSVPQEHGDFFTFPMMRAFKLFEGFVPDSLYKTWKQKLAKIDPTALYAQQKGKGNWNIVNLAGEFLRAEASMTDSRYYETCLEKQKTDFTSHGMFLEHGAPLAYDHFPRYFLASMLQDGYRGAASDFYREIIWRGAWTSLFMMSPTGEAPTGYRSSNHIWNEAQSAVTFEILATQYALMHKPREAGVFKRAAHLSLLALKRWIRPDGSGFVVKNRFPIDSQHGYEKYSSHTQYNLLACSMLITAWQSAMNDIAEQPSPADVGGYVVSIVPFHKIFANVGGNYLEYETSGDMGYNPTGIIRVHLKGTNPQLGLSDGCAGIFSGQGNIYALGPHWKSEGFSSSLAQQSKAPVQIDIQKQDTASCEWTLTYERLPANASGKDKIMVVENILLNKTGLIVNESITGKTGCMGITFPALVFDGQRKFPVEIDKNQLSLGSKNEGIKMVITHPSNALWNLKSEMIGHRNGMVQVAEFQKENIFNISVQMNRQQ